MAAATTAEELGQLVGALLQRSALIELTLVVGCLVLSWAFVRLVRGRVATPGSIWFGERVFDGVLFPVLALLLALLARWALGRGWLEGVPVAVFRVAVPVLTSLVVIRLTVRVLHRAFPDSGLMRVVERSVSWLAWIGVVLWVTGLLPLILAELDQIRWKFGATQISVRSLLEGVVNAVLVLVLALWLSAALEARLLAGSTINLSLRKIAANALRALLLFVGLLVALSAAGIDLTALGVLGGALGVGIGFGLQKLAANYVSGFVILAERSMRIGDLVKVDNFEGRITDITTRYTLIRALGGREAIVPNEQMITQRVESLTHADNNVALTTVVQVAYGTDVQALIPRIVEVVLRVPRVLPEPAPGVLLSNFADSGLELTVLFWIGDPENGQLGPRSAVNLALLRLFDELGVEIPFPQRVVHHRLPPGAAAAPAVPAAPAAPAAPSAGTAAAEGA
jgi:small-conductance mechanosensitive channel